MKTTDTDNNPTTTPAPDCVPIDGDASESPTESVISEEQACVQVEALAESYTMSDCQAAAKSHRRANLRSFLKARKGN